MSTNDLLRALTSKFVSEERLEYYTGKIKAYVTSAVNAAKTAVGNYTINGKKISTNPTIGKADVGLGNVTNDAQVKRSEMGQVNGVATLDDSGKVPSSQLPAYVDDIIEFNAVVATTGNIQASGIADTATVYYSTSKKAFFAESDSDASWHTAWNAYNGDKNLNDKAFGTGSTSGVVPYSGKIYVAKSSNKQYRWSGTDLVEISPSLALGETSSTAYPGDKGKAAYTHAVTNKGKAFASKLYKITTNAEGHVTAATAVTKADITALGIPGQDTKYTLPTAAASTLGGVKTGYTTSGKNYKVQVDASGNAFVNVPWTDNNTTYAVVTASANGLMSSAMLATLESALQAGDIQFVTETEIDAMWA